MIDAALIGRPRAVIGTVMHPNSMEDRAMDKDDQHRKTTPAVSEGRSIASPKPLDPAGRTKLASYHAKLILGSYRADQAADPEIYLTAIGYLLAQYPPDIGKQLTDPKDGVAGKYKWLPTVSEVKEEAEAILEAEAAERYRQRI